MCDWPLVMVCKKGIKIVVFYFFGSHKLIEVLDKLVRPVGVRLINATGHC